jgi:hypothetical protein
MKSALGHLVTVTLTVVFCVFIVVVFLDWFGGCGESWVQADGTRIMGECMGRELFFNLFK